MPRGVKGNENGSEGTGCKEIGGRVREMSQDGCAVMGNGSEGWLASEGMGRKDCGEERGTRDGREREGNYSGSRSDFKLRREISVFHVVVLSIADS